MDRAELKILETLDAAVRAVDARARIDEVVARVESKLNSNPNDVMAWEPVPLECFNSPLPEMIRSSWVFILRSRVVTGAERHPNSHQRMMSYRGGGDFQTRTTGEWESHYLKSDFDAPLEERWISIPPYVWHQGVVPEQNWVVVSFQTAAVDDLIEERPDSENETEVRQRKYVDHGWNALWNLCAD